MTPKISIVVPVFNTEKYLNECINSLINQSLKNIEIILVDDGSTDNSLEICNKYAKIDARVIVLKQMNKGAAAARNTGLDIAKGEYIGFVDSDDWINEKMYNILYSKAKEHDADIVTCNIEKRCKTGAIILFSIDKSEYMISKNDAMSILLENQRITYSPCNKIYNKKLFENLRFSEGIILEDKDLLYRLVDKANRVYYVGQPLYYYRYVENSTLHSEFSLKKLDEHMVMKDMYEFYQKFYPEYASRVYSRYFLTNIILYINLIKYNRSLIGQYKYLLNRDKLLLIKLNDTGFDRKNRLLIKIGYISPILLVKLYSIYLDKIRHIL